MTLEEAFLNVAVARVTLVAHLGLSEKSKDRRRTILPCQPGPLFYRRPRRMGRFLGDKSASTGAVGVITVALLSACAAQPVPAVSIPVEPPLAPIQIDALIVNDPDFPPVDETRIALMVREADERLTEKFGRHPRLNVVVRDTGVTTDFFAKHSESAAACLKKVTTAEPGADNLAKVDRDRGTKFLKSWSIEELRAALDRPENDQSINYESAYNAIMASLNDQWLTLASLRLPSGKALWKSRERSYGAWTCIAQAQSDYDLIITNAPILYDTVNAPTIMREVRSLAIGGYSGDHPKRDHLRQGVVLLSTFRLLGDVPEFSEPGVGSLSTDARYALLGRFVLAHEMVHALVLTPDFFDHPLSCLMQGTISSGWVAHDRLLRENPGFCPKCEPWRRAYGTYLDAEQLFDDGRWNEGLDAYHRVLKETPKAVSGTSNYFAIRFFKHVSDRIAAASRNGFKPTKEVATNLMQATKQWMGAQQTGSSASQPVERLRQIDVARHEKGLDVQFRFTTGDTTIRCRFSAKAEQALSADPKLTKRNVTPTVCETPDSELLPITIGDLAFDGGGVVRLRCVQKSSGEVTIYKGDPVRSSVPLETTCHTYAQLLNELFVDKRRTVYGGNGSSGEPNALVQFLVQTAASALQAATHR